MVPPTVTRTLSTADERREAVLAAAQKVFAERGLHGTPTSEIAKAAGISHAYLFRLFPTKADLAVAAVRAAHDRVYETFARVARQAREAGDDPKKAMAQAYEVLLLDRNLLLMQMHAFAAAPGMPQVREASRENFARLVDLVERETGLPPEEIELFFAHGMLMNVMAALDADKVDAHWADVLTCTWPEED